jgi:hypothetical protein
MEVFPTSIWINSLDSGKASTKGKILGKDLRVMGGSRYNFILAIYTSWISLDMIKDHPLGIGWSWSAAGLTVVCLRKMVGDPAA